MPSTAPIPSLTYTHLYQSLSSIFTPSTVRYPLKSPSASPHPSNNPLHPTTLLMSHLTPRQMLEAKLQSGKFEQIEFLYDESIHQQSATENYINQGDEAFARGRQAWRTAIDQELQMDADLKAQGKNKASARSMSTVDIDYVTTCLSRYKSFSSPDGEGVSLDLMAEILETSWIEAPML